MSHEKAKMDSHTCEVQDRQWLTLAQLPRFSVAKLGAILRDNKLQIADLFSADLAFLLRSGFSDIQAQCLLHPNMQQLENSMLWCQQPNHVLLNITSEYYPKVLLQTARPPLLLYCAGNKRLLNNPQLAIVGSRNPSVAGKQNAKYFAQALSLSGWTVTSGLALGIDGLAHEAVLQVKGHTVAILGTGLNNIYPKRHVNMAKRILEQNGVLLSEFFPDTPARPENFPRRNRIISGMSLGTLIIEAAIKSGSLITARYALEQNRDVFAVPGNIHNLLSRGCHYLIKQGAKLVENVSDINEEYQHLALSFLNTKPDELQKSARQSLASDKLLDSVEFETTPLDIVVERCGMPVAEVMSQLLEYELRGLVTAVPGGYLKLGEK
ncbi:DNA-processing protein DprA [Paraglaciecola polaris]|uniref:DNA processing protein n=1 Tax=Paraglaciecola polaris LMG 21857 TaxID=1129793 RepID=K6ZHR2_9ALTE|nr:DNA-processing protein DprA [Paraglaciecola polaris]GAC35551.1 DNA processing protein [Paraglaciecola polaris LMG 21857]|tara:strand:+ start:21527 stop:22666 length:1140 start_codon:yes stop_codon:yes gene_type:complete